MPLLLAFITAAAVAAYLSGPLSDPDLWWHLAVGRWILAQNAVPTVDHWNQFAIGQPWIAYSWLNELIYAFVEQSWGLSGLVGLQSLLALVIAGSCYRICRKLSGSELCAALLTILTGLCLYPYFGLRPQAFSWVLLLWTLHFAGEIAKPGSRIFPFVMLAVTIALWANTNITMAIGIGVAISWSWDRTRPQGALKTGLLCLAASSVTPYFIGGWLTFFQKSAHPFSHMYIQEFQPATIFSLPSLVLLLEIGIAGLLLHQSAQHPPETPRPQISRLLVAAAMLMGAATVQKFLPFACIVLALLIAELWPQRLTVDSWQQFCRTTLLVCCALIAFRTWDRQAWNEHAIDYMRVPVEPLDFIRDHKLPQPLLYGFGEGGYVLYRQTDAHGIANPPAVIDGRTNVNPPEVVRAYLDALKGRETWTDYVSMIDPKTILWVGNFPLVPLLLKHGEWCHVYPAPDSELDSSPWSVFVARSDFPGLNLPSRNCGQPLH